MEVTTYSFKQLKHSCKIAKISNDINVLTRILSKYKEKENNSKNLKILHIIFDTILYKNYSDEGLDLYLWECKDNFLHNHFFQFILRTKNSSLLKEAYYLFKDKDSNSVMSSIISNNNTPSEILEDVFKNEKHNFYLLLNLARNINTPEYIILELVHYTNCRTYISHRENLYESVFNIIAEKYEVYNLKIILLKHNLNLDLFLEKYIDNQEFSKIETFFQHDRYKQKILNNKRLQELALFGHPALEKIF